MKDPQNRNEHQSYCVGERARIVHGKSTALIFGSLPSCSHYILQFIAPGGDETEPQCIAVTIGSIWGLE